MPPTGPATCRWPEEPYPKQGSCQLGIRILNLVTTKQGEWMKEGANKDFSSVTEQKEEVTLLASLTHLADRPAEASQLRTYANIFKSTEHIPIKGKPNTANTFLLRNIFCNSQQHLTLQDLDPTGHIPPSFRQASQSIVYSFRNRTNSFCCLLYIE